MKKQRMTDTARIPKIKLVILKPLAGAVNWVRVQPPLLATAVFRLDDGRGWDHACHRGL
jgi:hypothetical protein